MVVWIGDCIIVDAYGQEGLGSYRGTEVQTWKIWTYEGGEVENHVYILVRENNMSKNPGWRSNRYVQETMDYLIFQEQRMY